MSLPARGQLSEAFHAVDPHWLSWMMFVDGENLTLRAQELARVLELPLDNPAFHQNDVFTWLPETLSLHWNLRVQPVRLNYYTSVQGDDPSVHSVEERLRAIGFQPVVFKKSRRERRPKGVDIAFTRDVLCHAFRDNYEATVLVAGDGDYAPLIEEVQRLGKRVFVAFFGNNALHRNLRILPDDVLDIRVRFIDAWLTDRVKRGAIEDPGRRPQLERERDARRSEVLARLDRMA